MLDFDTFLVTVVCLIDDWLTTHPAPLRQRGPAPVLHDSEVLTIEVVGAYLGIATEKRLFTHFRRHYGSWFPGLRTIHRTTFVRQAANLWQVKQRLWQDLLRQLQGDPALSLVDGFAVPICRFARAYRCRRLREWAAYGYDDMSKQTYLGLRAHLRVCWPGIIVDFRLAPANIHELKGAADLLSEARGWALGDRNYWSPDLAATLREQGVHLLAPSRSAKRERHPWPRWLIAMRRRIETVIGQLVDRYQVRQVWARDAWHLWSRWLRAVLSHTVLVHLCQQAGLSPLQFAGLVTD